MGAWIEIMVEYDLFQWLRSHPTMGAWIEILTLINDIAVLCVAPHDGCVD